MTKLRHVPASLLERGIQKAQTYTTMVLTINNIVLSEIFIVPPLSPPNGPVLTFEGKGKHLKFDILILLLLTYYPTLKHNISSPSLKHGADT